MTENILINSGNYNNYIQFRSTDSSNNALFGILTTNMFVRMTTSSSKFQIQNSSASNAMSYGSTFDTTTSTGDIRLVRQANCVWYLIYGRSAFNKVHNLL
jgi:hypothetical protein